MNRSIDLLVVGGGVMGLTLAREFHDRDSTLKITILEKEAEIGAHASGRNSGVIHAGIYYAADSLKGKMCVTGAKLLKGFCEEKGIPVNKVGKIIVPKNDEEVDSIPKLAERAKANGAQVSIIGPDDIKRLEPQCVVALKAIYSPNTACVNPKEVLKALAEDLSHRGVQILYNSSPTELDIDRGIVTVGGDQITFKFLINAAGSYADKIAKKCGAGLQYSLMPFRGKYFQVNPDSRLKISTNIYPVPDIRQPFLGVHFTKSTSEAIYIGPTAMPALGRENYSWFKNIDWVEIPGNLRVLARQYLINNDGFRSHVHSELNRLLEMQFFKEAQKLVPALRPKDIIKSKKSGIRAQLVNNQSKKLVMDFVVERAPTSIHVLNAVSPGFTCSFSFAKYVADIYATDIVS